MGAPIYVSMRDGISRETADQYQPAINRIFHDAAHPSHLILPIRNGD